MDKIKILALSDSPLLNTGFSTVTMNILNRLSDIGYDCTLLGQAIPHSQKLVLSNPNTILKSWGVQQHNLKLPELVPSVYLSDGTTFKFNLIGQGLEPYCKDIVEPYIRMLQPNIFFTLLDTFMVYPWFLDTNFTPAKTIFYYPSDGDPFLPGGHNACENILKRMSKSVAMSKYGQKQVKEVYGLDTDYIPHAYDNTIFYPLTEEEKKINKARWGILNRFVVGCVARNQPRKMMDRTVKAFAHFAKDKDDVVLILHLDPMDRAAAFDINKLIQTLKIENKVIYTGVQYFSGFTYEQMREIYNLFDVFLLLTSGEGFGIPLIEAMACEIPVICTDYTTSKELIIDDGQSGELVKLSGTHSYLEPIYTTITGSWNVERGLADIIDGANMLNKLYYDRELCKTYGKTGRRKALHYYTWDVVMPQWDKLFKELLNE